MLHIVRGVRRDAQRQRTEERRAGPSWAGGVDRVGQSVWDRRIESFRPKASSGYRSCGGRDGSALQPGTDRGPDKQAQVRQAFDVRARKVRLVETTCALRSGSLKVHFAT